MIVLVGIDCMDEETLREHRNVCCWELSVRVEYSSKQIFSEGLKSWGGGGLSCRQWFNLIKTLFWTSLVTPFNRSISFRLTKELAEKPQNQTRNDTWRVESFLHAKMLFLASSFFMFMFRSGTEHWRAAHVGTNVAGRMCWWCVV